MERLQQLRDALAVERAGEEEALPELTFHRLEPGKLIASLDPFGHEFHTERLSEPDDRCGQLLRTAHSPEVVDERLVDLQQVERELTEITQRGISGTEVVDRETNA